jgi:hypothetical protein
MQEILLKVRRGIQLRGIQVLLILTAYLLLAPYLPTALHQAFYTISLFIKDLLVWMLPLTVGLFIAHVICSFEERAPFFVLALILFEGLSNLSSVWYAYGAGHIAVDYLPPISLPVSSEDFNALWRLPFSKPVWWSADKGTLLGLFLGFLGIFTKNTVLRQVIDRGKEKAQWVLTKVFSRLIPLFVLGFVARMYKTEMLHHVFRHYAALLFWLLGFLAIYITFLFLIGSDGTLKGFLRSIKNLLPAGGIAFSSGCSLSTMPWTIQGAAKNLKNPDFAKAVIPATTNIQQIGDCIINTFLCFLIYKHFFGITPDLDTWVTFSFVFVLARFATAAVLGGAIFIMLPIYENYLSFTPEMIAIILAFNVVLDPIVTSSNVIANGALCRIFEKFWMALPVSAKPSRDEKPADEQ